MPIRIIIMSRRVNYLHYLLTRNKDEMLYQFFDTQWKYPVKNDWTETVKQDLVTLDINFSIEKISSMKKETFSEIFIKIRPRDVIMTS